MYPSLRHYVDTPNSAKTRWSGMLFDLGSRKGIPATMAAESSSLNQPPKSTDSQRGPIELRIRD
jgi:hypothetical protein